jgi:PAP2 superfamily
VSRFLFSAPRRMVLTVMVAAAWFGAQGAAAAQPNTMQPQEVLRSWYKLSLELVRHTATYTPPVASRSLAYLGVTAFEAVAAGSPDLRSLAGQLNELQAAPQRKAGKTYNEAVVMQAAMSFAAGELFSNTGPTGHRAMAALEAKLRADVSKGVPGKVVARSEAYGRAVAQHILAWSRGDGGAAVENMGFPMQYELTKGPAHWVPTNVIVQQQKPLLPNWGKNRTFAMPNGAACALPAPPEYSEDKTSAFYKQALEVYEAKQNLTPEQRAIARFWSDDAMLSVTPPGHWIGIALQIFERDNVGLEKSVDVLARLGVAEADAFVGCWNAKYQYDLLRPLTYIRRVIDPKWESLINTPPFPEYPSGHSTQSGAAATVLTSMFGDNFVFADTTGQKDGLGPRSFTSFWAAANEAGISRMYGGIHFRSAIERGLEQGRCVGGFATALRTKR